MKWVVSRSWVWYDVWVMVRLWLKWVVGRWRLPVFMSSEVMVRLAWVTVMGLVEIGVGHHMVGWFFWVLPFRCFFFFFFSFNMGFCSGGILVGSGGMVGMVEALSSGGAMIEVEGRWRRKLEKKKEKKNIYFII